MKWLPSLLLLPSLFTLCLASVAVPNSDIFYVETPETDVEPMSRSFTALYDAIVSAYDPLNPDSLSNKRDLQSTLEGLLQTVNNSGVIIDVLHEIADSPVEMNTLANYIVQILVSALTNTAIKGLNITVNFTDIVDKVMDSGIIQSTAIGLLFDDTIRNRLADNIGEVLVNHTWIPALIYKIGTTGQATWKLIFDTVHNTVSKDPGFNGTSYPKRDQIQFEKRDNGSEYSGSLNTFISNLAGSAISSDLFSESLDSILAAVDQSNIVIPIVLSVTGDLKIQTMVGFIANKLYNYGLFDQIPLNDYFQEYKKNGKLSASTQFAFGDPTWSPAVAKLFYRWDTQGVMDQIRKNLYGK